jgi:uncharacterized membrane protein YidH (DUF202 family)
MDIFLLGPFVKLGPLRNSEVANFVGFVSTISLIIILTTALLAYGYVTFSDSKENKTTVDFLNSKDGVNLLQVLLLVDLVVQVLYVLLKLVGTSLSTFNFHLN